MQIRGFIDQHCKGNIVKIRIAEVDRAYPACGAVPVFRRAEQETLRIQQALVKFAHQIEFFDPLEKLVPVGAVAVGVVDPRGQEEQVRKLVSAAASAGKCRDAGRRGTGAVCP